MRRLICFLLMLAAMGLAGPARAEANLEWYYNERFQVYRDYEPEKHEAILAALCSEVPQTHRGGGCAIRVTETAWAPEGRVLVVALAAVPENTEETELHPLINLDADGAYIGREDVSPLEDELRKEHWLWTEEDFGPVEEMIAPGKRLLLLDACEIWLDDVLLLGDGSGWDAYATPEGTLYTVMEIRLDEALRAMLEARAEQGVLVLRAPYALYTYSDNDEQMAASAQRGEITFEVDIR